MIDAFVKAVSQLLSDRGMWKIAFTCVLLALLVFAAVGVGVWFLLTNTSVTELGWLETTIDLLGGLATLALTWVLFPAVVSATVGIFLESAAGLTEKRYYPDLPEATGIGFFAGLGVTLRYLVVLVVLNVLLLFLWIFPVVYLPAYYLVNGYLLGREYLELVSLRRADSRVTAGTRRQHRIAGIVFGTVVTLGLTVPILNLLVPLVATAAMVHLVHRWRPAAP